MFRQTTAPGSVLSSHWLQERIFNSDPTPISTDELIENLDKDGLWEFDEHFLEVRTRGMYEAIKADVLREKADRDVIAEAGIMKSIGAGLLVAPLDPLNWWAPVAAVNLTRAGARVAYTTMRTAGIAGLTTAAQEPFLQGSQILRTAEEAAWDLGGSIVVGGVLGFGVSVTPIVANKAARTMRSWIDGEREGVWHERLIEAHSRVWEDANKDILTNPKGRQQQGGTRLPSVKQIETRDEAFDALQASAERYEAWKEMRTTQTGPLEWVRTAPGRLLSKVAGAHFRDPIDLVMRQSSSLAAREALELLIEIPVLLQKNFEGKATAQAVTTEVDKFLGLWAQFRSDMYGGSLTEAGKRMAGQGKSILTEARRAGFTGTTDEFEKEVVLAVVRGYTHANPAIEKASLMFKQVTDAVKDLAIKAGYDIKDADAVKFALGYSPRKYIIDAVRGPDGQGTAFIKRAKQAYYDDIFDVEFTSQGKVPTPAQLRGIRGRSQTLAKQAFRRISREETEAGGLVQANIRAGNLQNARVLPIPDEELILNGWIDPRASDLLNVHVRQTVPALLMAQRFKSPTGLADPDLSRSVIPKIEKDYEQLLTTVQNPAERRALLEEKDQVISTFRTLADQIVHGYRVGAPGPSRRAWERWETAIQGLKVFQAMRLMGGLVMSSIPDLGSLQIRNGLSRPLKALINDLRASQLADFAKLKGLTPDEVASEAKRWGAAIEWETNASIGAQLDLLSPYQARTPIQKYMAGTSKVFSVSNFSIWWNNSVKTQAFRVGMDRILEAAEKGFDNLHARDKEWMLMLGLDKAAVNRIGAAWRGQSGGLHDNFLRVAYASNWGDQEAARILGNALAKDNASTVIRPRTGDKAVIWNNPVVQIITQFQNFISSHALRTLTLAEQRIIRERGFGRDSMRVYGGMITYAALGMLSVYLGAMARDASAQLAGQVSNQVEKLFQNPGQWMAIGIERSGLTGMYGYFNTYWERLGGVGATRPLQNMMGDESLNVQARGYWQDKDPIETIGGPTAGTIAAGLRHSRAWWNHAFDDRDFKKKDAWDVRYNSPFQNHILARPIFDAGQRWYGEDVLGLQYDD